MLGLRCWLCGLMVALQMLALWICLFLLSTYSLGYENSLWEPGALSVLLASLVGAEGQP